MKKISLLLLAVLTIGLNTVNAQKPFAGIIKSKVTIEGTTDPNILAQVPDELVVYMYGNYTKTVVKSPGAIVSVITNGETKVMNQIFEVTGMGKYIIETTESEISEAHANREYNYNYTGEKKMIAGYSCEKVILTTIDKETDEETELILYVSKDLNANPNINFASQPGLVGYPLCTQAKTEINGTEITQTTEAFEVTPSKKVKLVDFMLPSDGQKVTMEELMKKFGMGGDDDE
ncbi:MAG: hypothetical protein J5642_03410 [Bacteroidales bacterium]|nr:hypothetical protein [Bacteroidales bacterium]